MKKFSPGHEFRIEGGGWPDLIRIVEENIFYQMQHPWLLDLFVEPTARLRARVEDGSALIIVEPDEKSMRIQKPLGPGGPRLFEDEMRSAYLRRGILAAGLDAQLLARLRELCPTARAPIAQNVELSDLDEFDLDLGGSQYKSLRNSLRHAEREGITVEPYDAALHGDRALKVFTEWNSIKPRVATFWIPNLLSAAGSRAPGLILVVAVRRTRVLGVSAAFVAGPYAYMLLALTLQEHGRSQELMDYELMKKLKSAGVRRLDWGISDAGPISAYKKKYGRIALHPISTCWIPP
ncbi:MAG: hypothetical protein A3G34_08310 [Candidatus Lindowbacteria bacterium RIFCSPLOWO2_12_FULL_62_27]|nr:MAG: hypothetical protein A3I06_14725 [Candidatus Lindowbacteria bacterium RIFCSPLOWO2_02_FULL_62_12]OGH58462.1 MAG: hypothetical protein A3G34_08310 [Candidatus Lindowbacteria bacterium RIFCSPLOWO2_12_FULL_62_27]